MLAMFSIWLLRDLIRSFTRSQPCDWIGLIVLHSALICGREYLNSPRKVVLAFVADIILKARLDPMLTVENNLVRDLHHEEAPFWGFHIDAPDHPFRKALHGVG